MGPEKKTEAAGNSSQEEGGQLPREQESDGGGGGKVCGVCGDRALAHNFGALTCETCKAFFRRNAVKAEAPRCMFNNNCAIEKTTRRHCSACRLKKCFSIGMKPQLILDDSAKKARMTLRQKKRSEREEARQQGEGRFTTFDPLAAPAANTCPQQASSTGIVSSTSVISSHTTTAAVSSSMGVTNSTTIKSAIESTGTVDSLGVAALSPSGVAMFPVGSATSMTMSPTSAAVDLFFQQALDGVESSSQEVRCEAPVAVELWARPSAGPSCSSWPLQQSEFYLQMSASATQDGGGRYPSTPQDALGQHQVKQPSSVTKQSDGFSFQHVPREDLPSDMKQYWLLTSDERATLTQLTSAYQDTMMKMTDRDPSKNVDSSSGGLTMDDYFFVLDQLLHLCVRFAKALPDFWQLKQPDQIAILKASCMQCYGIAASAMCVPERGVWLTPFGEVGISHMPAAMNSDPFIADVFSFCCGLKSVAKTDITIYGLLHSVTLFDPGVITVDDKQLVNSLNDKYLILLKHYLASEFSYQHADRYLGVLMERLHKLRSLSQQSVSFYKRFSSCFKPLGAEFFQS